MSLFRRLVNPLGNIHRQGVLPDIFIFSAPRTGSTFLMELLSAQPGMKVHNEPFSMNFPNVQRELGVDNWRDATIMPNREEVYRRYVEDRRAGRISDMLVPFWSRGGQFFTTRNTFKILHAAEDMIPWFEKTFNGAIVLLIRHPIPTVQSHAKHPRLDYFLQQPGMRDQLAPEHLSFAETVLKSDDQFARGVLDWCLQYYPAFANGVADSWTVISYEDLAVNAEAAVAGRG